MQGGGIGPDQQRRARQVHGPGHLPGQRVQVAWTNPRRRTMSVPLTQTRFLLMFITYTSSPMWRPASLNQGRTANARLGSGLKLVLDYSVVRCMQTFSGPASGLGKCADV